MSNENMIVPQSGYYFPGNVGPYQPNAIPQPFIYHNQQYIFSQPYPGNEIFARFQQMPPPILSPQVDSESNYRLIPREELEKLLPRDIAPERLESGVLPDGRAYAQRNWKREAYFLFPSRRAYVLHFAHYYFSKENLDRDDIIRSMMDSNHAIPIERIIEAPRLSAVGTTVEEMKAAVENESNVLLHFVGADGKGYLRRIDGYPGTNPVENTSSQTNGPSSGSSVDNTSKGGAGESEASSAQQGPPMFDGQGHSSTTESSSVYNPHQGFLRASSRSQALNSLSAAMAGMSLGQQIPTQQNPLQAPPPPGAPVSHPSIPTNPQLLQQFQLPPHLFTSFARYTSGLPAFAHFGQPPFVPGQVRTMAPPPPLSHLNQQSQSFFHHQQAQQQQQAAQLHRRLSSPPPPPPGGNPVGQQSQVPPSQTSASAMAAINLAIAAATNFQPPHGAAMYNLPSLQDINLSLAASGFPQPSPANLEAWMAAAAAAAAAGAPDGVNPAVTAAMLNAAPHPYVAPPLPNANAAAMAAGPQMMAWPPTHHNQTAPHQHHHQAPVFSAPPPPPPSHASTGASSTAATTNTITTTSSAHEAGSNRTDSPAEASASQAVKEVPSAAASAATESGNKKSTTTPPPAQSQQQQQHSRPNSNNSQKGRGGKTSGGKGAQQQTRGGARNNSNRSPQASAELSKDAATGNRASSSGVVD